MGDACGHGLPVYDPPPEKPPYADRTPMGDTETEIDDSYVDRDGMTEVGFNPS
jgi:hypothetical protein